MRIMFNVSFQKRSKNFSLKMFLNTNLPNIVYNIKSRDLKKKNISSLQLRLLAIARVATRLVKNGLIL